MDVDADAGAVAAHVETIASDDNQQAEQNQHLARFEFSDLGTKILMVEWYPGAVAALSPVAAPDGPVEKSSSPGPDSDPKTESTDPDSISAPRAESLDQPPASTPADAVAIDSNAGGASVPWEVSWPGKTTVLPVVETDNGGSRRRVYFLLPPGAPIPANITVTAPHRAPLHLKALPAIFPEGFAPEGGRRGVLHTIWAKKRLSELDDEMKDEMRNNAESVALEMAQTEKQWLIDNFLSQPSEVPSARTKSPVGGRLGDKLRGLKLVTSPTDLLPTSTANTFTQTGSQSKTLTPQGADIAVPSYSAVSRGPLNTAPMSLNAALHDPLAASAPVRFDSEDDLFALPLSPRSPDMQRSPFSAL